MAKQTQGTMLIVGALVGTVGFVAFLALMIVGDYAFSPALFLAIVVAAAVAVFLLIGFHRKPSDSGEIVTNAPPPSAKAPTVPSAHAATTPSAMAAEAPDAGSNRSAAEMAPAPDPDTAAARIDTEGTSSVPAGEEKKPETLDGPRDGGADDLKKIKGVGPKLEELCNSMGFYHFDQIANWTPAEVAWVDENLEGFKGRVSRDDWVAQAKTLAAGGETEFSKKVEGGDVY